MVLEDAECNLINYVTSSDNCIVGTLGVTAVHWSPITLPDSLWTGTNLKLMQQIQRYHLFILCILLPLQNLVPTLPKMQLSH